MRQNRKSHVKMQRHDLGMNNLGTLNCFVCVSSWGKCTGTGDKVKEGSYLQATCSQNWFYFFFLIIHPLTTLFVEWSNMVVCMV